MLRCFFVVTILRLWEEGKIPSIPKIKVTINYTIRNILPFLIDFNSFFTTPTNCVTSIATEVENLANYRVSFSSGNGLQCRNNL